MSNKRILKVNKIYDEPDDLNKKHNKIIIPNKKTVGFLSQNKNDEPEIIPWYEIDIGNMSSREVNEELALNTLISQAFKEHKTLYRVHYNGIGDFKSIIDWFLENSFEIKMQRYRCMTDDISSLVFSSLQS